MSICKCGRGYTHCHWCGGTSLYALQKRSLSRTIELGKETTTYRCKRCMKETDEGVDCVALSETLFSTDFVSKQSIPQPKPYGNLDVKSIEYREALLEAVRDIQSKKMIPVKEACKELEKLGWVVEFVEEEERVPVTVSTTKEPEAAPISLDEIIKHMQDTAREP